MGKKPAFYCVIQSVSILVILALMLSACNLPGLLSSSAYDSEDVISQKATIAIRMTLTKEGEAAPTSTAIPPTITPTSEVQCAYVWTLRQDDELISLFRSELDSDIRESSDLGVVWYGENCIDVQTNSLVRFYASNLDITIMLEKENDFTKQWLGDRIKLVMEGIEKGLLQRPDVEDYPINLHFVYEIDGKNNYLEFDLSSYRKANPDNLLAGEDLFSSLFD